jgi:anti-anti-sigma factor
MQTFGVQIENLPRAGSYLVKAQGSIDMKTAPELELACERLLVRGEERLLFDFTNVEYINSQGLGVLLALQKSLSAKGGGVTVAGLSERVRKVFETTGIHKVMNLYDRPKDALAQDQLFREG